MIEGKEKVVKDGEKRKKKHTNASYTEVKRNCVKYIKIKDGELRSGKEVYKTRKRNEER